MIQSQNILETKKKVTKAQVKASIRKTGKWCGFIYPNKVSIYSLWHSPCKVEFISNDEVEKLTNEFLYYMNPLEGNNISFYE